MLRVTMTSTMPVAMIATEAVWTDRFQRLRGVRNTPPERMSKPIQMTASAASMPSMRTSISSFDRSEPEAALGGGAVVATGAVMEWLVVQKCHSGAAKRSPESITADGSERGGTFTAPLEMSCLWIPGSRHRRAPE